MKSKFAQYFAVVPLPDGSYCISRLKPCPPEIEQEFMQKLNKFLATTYPNYKVNKVSDPQMNQLVKDTIAKQCNSQN